MRKTLTESRIARWFLVIATMCLVAAVAYAIGRESVLPDCPTEDSCSIDYRDGGWHIEAVIP